MTSETEQDVSIATKPTHCAPVVSPNWGNTCVQNELALPNTQCTARHGDIGWCVIQEIGGSPVCAPSCDTAACPSGFEKIPIIGGDCYCRSMCPDGMVAE